MNREEKRAFIVALCDGMKQDLLNKLDSMPEEWDGHELREYLKDQTIISAAWVKMSSTRKKRYRNELQINGKL